MSTVPNDIDAIRQQMAQIRRELHEDVREVVEGAEAATDWKRYLTRFPWVTLGTAFAVGYFIVPRRHKTVATRADVSRLREEVEAAREEVVEAASKKGAAEAPRKKTLVGAALGMLVPLTVRAAQGYAMKYLEHWIAAQQAAVTTAGPAPRPAGPPGGGPGRPTGPRRGVGPGSA